MVNLIRAHQGKVNSRPAFAVDQGAYGKSVVSGRLTNKLPRIHVVPFSGMIDVVVDPVDAARADLDVSLSWHMDTSGALRGELRARNVSDRTVRLTGKPALKPLDVDDVPLAAACIVSAEMIQPGFLDIGAGEEAVAPVSWSGWVGAAASGHWDVKLPGGIWRVRATGPCQPTLQGPATNVSSTWWRIPADGSDT